MMTEKAMNRYLHLRNSLDTREEGQSPAECAMLLTVTVVICMVARFMLAVV